MGNEHTNRILKIAVRVFFYSQNEEVVPLRDIRKKQLEI